MDIDEEILLHVLKYIDDNIEADIINISAGITYSYKYNELHEVCKSLYNKNTLIVSAFDNDGAISYPAMFDEVVGVDTIQSYDNRSDIITSNAGIVDVYIPNIYYRTLYLGKKTLIKGTSFACAKVTGMLSLQYQKSKNAIDKHKVLKTISTEKITCNKSIPTKKPDYVINKAIIFPVNKETQALLRFSDLLSFEIFGVYDEKLAGRVGETIFGKKIQSFDSIKWDDDFDTVILSCTTQLSQITKRNYAREIVAIAHEHNKKVYSFESIENSTGNCFCPSISTEVTPMENCKKLHQITIPVIGVWGTSSKQGKYTLQLSLIRRLREMGYKTGHISTEPSGYLFDH